MKKNNVKSSRSIKYSRFVSFFGIVAMVCLLSLQSSGQKKYASVDEVPVNYDEEKVPDYTLPDPLVLQNGKKSNPGKNLV